MQSLDVMEGGRVSKVWSLTREVYTLIISVEVLVSQL